MPLWHCTEIELTRERCTLASHSKRRHLRSLDTQRATSTKPKVYMKQNNLSYDEYLWDYYIQTD